MLTAFLDLLFPPRCASCAVLTRGNTHRAICDACYARIPIHRSLFCGQCHARLPEQKKICHATMPFLLGAGTDYSDPRVRSLIHDLKFRFRKEAAVPIGALLARYARTLTIPLEQYVIVPIPLSKKRERLRGFNQSLLIARALGSHVNLSVRTDMLVRRTHTPPQTTLEDHNARHQNVRGCFAIARTPLSNAPSVLLVDDVVTSGATLREASQTLKQAGVQKIIGLAAARA